MTKQAVRWLPEDTPLPEAAAAGFRSAVARWQAEWFGNAELDPKLEPRDAPAAVIWRGRDHAIEYALSLDPVAIGANAAAIASQPLRHGADQRLLAKLGDDCANDLASGLASVFGPPQNSEPGLTNLASARCYSIELSFLTIWIRLSADRFAGLVDCALAPLPGRPAVTPIEGAIAKTITRAHAGIGQCALTLRELEALELGDVVVLQASSNDCFPLLVAGRPSNGSCRLRDDKVVAFEIVQPPTELIS